jgi:putative flippase GtrA
MGFNLRLCSNATLRRWLVFNSVGAMGILVQTGTLLVLVSRVRLNYLLATGLAVEAAILHNFFWHEHWTWVDRVRRSNGFFIRRLVYFHLANGAISLAGNILIMRIFVEKLSLNYLPANMLAITLCAVINFFAGDRIVFGAVQTRSKSGEGDMKNKYNQNVIRVFLLFALIFLCITNAVKGADLRPETLKAWNAYVEAAERRIQSELSAKKGFLALDFQEARDAIRERQSVEAGDIPVSKMVFRNGEGNRISVSGGMIHHWRGSVFVPAVTLDHVLSRVENPTAGEIRQEDVLDTRVLDHSPGQLKLYIKLQRSKIVTVVYNTEHLVQYQRIDSRRASSRSIATKIAEIERYGSENEREKPEGQDHGFLWRMNSYWRYEKVNGGVIVECESMTLSRAIPSLLEYMIRPIINSVARESMHRTLQSLRLRLAQKTASVGSISQNALNLE